MSEQNQRSLAQQVLELCRTRGMRVATAESCTGGLVAAALTAISGSSDVVECGFVTYSNAAKQKEKSDAALYVNARWWRR